MDIDMNYFRAIQGSINCNTNKEILLRDLKEDYKTYFDSSICIEHTFNNGVPQDFLIMPTKEERKSVIKSRADETFNYGDIVSFKNSNWIVTNINVNNEPCTDGVIEKCNQLFRFQNGDSEIYECWGLVVAPYYAASYSGKLIDIPNDKRKFILPYNDNTKKIHRDKRFITEISYDKDGNKIPMVYRVSSLESSTTTYIGNGGLLTLNVEFDVARESDNIEKMVADYITPKSSAIKTVVFTGSKKVRVGTQRNYSIAFVNNGVQETKTAYYNFIIPSDLSRYITKVESNNAFTISVENNIDAIGKYITVKSQDVNGAYPLTEYKIQVVSSLG